MTAVGPRAVTAKSPSAPRGRAPAGRYRAGRRRRAPGRRPGDSGDCEGGTPVKWTRADAADGRGGRVCGDSWLPWLRVLGDSSCTSPGESAWCPEFEFAFEVGVWRNAVGSRTGCVSHSVSKRRGRRPAAPLRGAGDRDDAGLRASLAGVFRGPRSRMCVR